MYHHDKGNIYFLHNWVLLAMCSSSIGRMIFICSSKVLTKTGTRDV